MIKGLRKILVIFNIYKFKTSNFKKLCDLKEPVIGHSDLKD